MSSKYTLKTKPTEKDPMQVIAEIPDAKKQADARALLSHAAFSEGGLAQPSKIVLQFRFIK